MMSTSEPNPNPETNSAIQLISQATARMQTAMRFALVHMDSKQPEIKLKFREELTTAMEDGPTTVNKMVAQWRKYAYPKEPKASTSTPPKLQPTVTTTQVTPPKGSQIQPPDATTTPAKIIGGKCVVFPNTPRGDTCTAGYTDMKELAEFLDDGDGVPDRPTAAKKLFKRKQPKSSSSSKKRKAKPLTVSDDEGEIRTPTKHAKGRKLRAKKQK